MIKAPWYSPEEDLAFTMYAISQTKIENLIDELVHADDPNDFWTQRNICRKLDLNLDDLTDNEIHYIEEEVARRWSM